MWHVDRKGGKSLMHATISLSLSMLVRGVAERTVASAETSDTTVGIELAALPPPRTSHEAWVCDAHGVPPWSLSLCSKGPAKSLGPLWVSSRSLCLHSAGPL